MSRSLKILRKTIIAFTIIIILFGFTETANMVTGNWYQQFMPNLNNMAISDIYFLDTLTGWAVTNNNMPQDSGYILKTTNGGDNWIIKYKDKRDFGRIKFIDVNTGFACGGTGSGTSYLYKSTNGGDNWTALTVPGNNFYNDMVVLNVDTLWLVDADGLLGGVYRTTNGGVNWTLQFSGGGQNPNKIYMFNARIGFMSNNNVPNIYKTTNSGLNWSVNLLGENFTDMHFIDSLTGWKCTNSSNQAGQIKKTTNGGVNWTVQNLPPETPPLSFSRMFKFSFVNQDTIWGVGGVYAFANGQDRAIIYKTTNGGNNWYYQIPDTSINIFIYNSIQFIDAKKGWAYSPLQGGVHTVTGGDTITAVHQLSNEVPKNFELEQNYPNPFNPTTIINYELRVTNYVKLLVYDIQGREITVLVDQKQNPGTYSVDFSGSNLSSGVYFYKIEADKFVDAKKMVLVK